MARSPVAFKKFSLDALKPEKKIFWQKIEGYDGFYLRVSPGGTKAWYFIYRMQSSDNKKYLSLGGYPAVGLDEARDKYIDAQKLAEKGIDPAVKYKADEEEAESAMTVDKLIAEYIERHAKPKKRSWEQDLSFLNREIAPKWGKKKVEEITRKDVVRLLDSIVDRGSPASANKLLTIARKMFRFAVRRSIIEYSPFSEVDKPAHEASKDRYLNDNEISQFWRVLDGDIPLLMETRRALKLILVTGQRGGEVCGMHTSELSDEETGKWWTIPVSRQKVVKTREAKRSPHRVYLTPLALEIIGPLTVIDKETKEEKARGYFFPSPRGKGTKHIDDHALAGAVRDLFHLPVMNEKGEPVFNEVGKQLTRNVWELEKFTPHDLRRTASTHFPSLGVIQEVNDAVLSHVVGGVSGVYNQYKYDTEKKTAMEQWERKLMSLINPTVAPE